MTDKVPNHPDIFDYGMRYPLDISLAITILANVFNVMAFVSTAWAVPHIKRYESEWSGFGLWKFCIHDGQWGIVKCSSMSEFMLSSWFKATQAFITMSFIGMKVALLLNMLHGSVRRLRDNRSLLNSYVLICFCSALFSSIGLIIFGAKAEQELSDQDGRVGWSFGLEVASAFLIILAGMFATLDILELWPKECTCKCRENTPDGIVAMETARTSTVYESTDVFIAGYDQSVPRSGSPDVVVNNSNTSTNQSSKPDDKVPIIDKHVIDGQ